MPSEEGKLYLHHLLILLTGFLIGIAAAFALMSVPFDFSGEIERARKLGIISRTVLDGYPKQRDIINYAAVLGFPLLFSIGGWLMWVRGERYKKITALFNGSPPPHDSTVGWQVSFAVVAIFYLIVSFACFRSPAYGKLASMLPWLFLGEEGANLAWVQSIMNGGIYGRDINCLYGPMLIYPLVWFMKCVGTTVATLRLYTYCLNLAAYGIIVVFLYRTLRFKITFFMAALIYFSFFSPFAIFSPNVSYLRVALGILPILLIYLYLEATRKWLLVVTGLILGQSILFSQEVGICSVLTVIAVFLLVRLPEKCSRLLLQEVGLIVAGLMASVTPMLGYFIAKGVLGDVINSMMDFPRLLALGFAALPFPDIRAFLYAPFANEAPIFYGTIFIYIVSALYLIPLFILRHRDRNTVLRLALLIFGILLYRSALGRSDETHALFVFPPALLLVFLLVDDALSVPKDALYARKATKIAVIILSFLMLAIVWGRKSPFYNVQRAMSYDTKDPQIPRMGVPASREAADTLVGIRNFIETNTRRGEYVYFFPNEAAFYFIFDRMNPTRYNHAFHAGTTEQRLELIGDLERKRPAFVIYNVDPVAIDDISAIEWSPEVDRYIKTNYRPIGRTNQYVFLKRVGIQN